MGESSLHLPEHLPYFTMRNRLDALIDRLAECEQTIHCSEEG